MSSACDSLCKSSVMLSSMDFSFGFHPNSFLALLARPRELQPHIIEPPMRIFSVSSVDIDVHSSLGRSLSLCAVLARVLEI